MDKEKYLKLKEILLYIFGVFIFLNFDILKILYYIICIFLMVDIFYYKDKFECGNKNLKTLILFIVLFGTLWNYFADFDYRAARAFFKINRYFLFSFYLYSLAKKDKKIISRFLLSIVFGYFLLVCNGINEYFIKENTGRYSGFNGIMVTALISSILGASSFINLISSKNKLEKGISGLVFCSSIFLIIISQTRAALLALIISILFSMILMKDLKKLIITVSIGLIALLIFLNTPQAIRFKTNTFNTEISLNNMSNGLRVEMWKNAIWRYKQHPITGTGTKQDKKLFKKYVDNMAETTSVEKYYKKIFQKGFDDSHSMYLNNLVYNGIFSFVQLFFSLILLPKILLKNYREAYCSVVLSSWIAYHIYGAVWPLNRGGSDPLIYWVMVGLILSSNITNENN